MNRRPGQVRVTTEVAYCSFCNRTRNLRREEHVLGNLVRTIVTCETCHRTLSSTMGVAAAEPEPVEAVAEPEPQPSVDSEERAPAKASPAKKPAAKRQTASKSAVKKPAAAVKSKPAAARAAKKK